MDIELPIEILEMAPDDIRRRIRLLNDEIRVMTDDSKRLTAEQTQMKNKIKENKEKVITSTPNPNTSFKFKFN